jgi:hypothetical protein
MDRLPASDLPGARSTDYRNPAAGSNLAAS